MITTVILLFLIEIYRQTSMKCNTPLISSYGYNGEAFAVNQPMLFCADVPFKCCNFLDELKHHKFWQTFYREKLDKTYEVISNLLQDIQPVMIWANNLEPAKYKSLTKKECKLPEIKKKITEVGFETTDELVAEMGSLKDIDVGLKEKFICFLCDIRNHFKVNDIGMKINTDAAICEQLLTTGRAYLEIKIKKLDRMLVLIDEVFSCMKIEDKAFDRDEKDVEELKGAVEDAEECLKSDYSIGNCSRFCAYYSIHDVSKGFIGNIRLLKAIIRNHAYLERIVAQTTEFESAAALSKKLAEEKKKKEMEKAMAKANKGKDKKKKKDGKDEEGDGKEKDKDKDGEGEDKDGDKKEGEGEDEEKEEGGEEEPPTDEGKLMMRILSEKHRSRSYYRKLSRIESKVRRYKSLMKRLKNKNKRMLKKIMGVNKRMTRNLNRTHRHFRQMPRYMQDVMPGVQIPNQIAQGQAPINNQIPQALPNIGIMNQAANAALQNQQPNPQQTLQNQAQTVTKKPEEKEEEVDPHKLLDENTINEIKKEADMEFYIDMYDKMNKGTIEDFKDVGWITNKFYDGSYLDGYMLSFESFGVTMAYNMTEYYSQTKEKIVETVFALKNLQPKKYDIPANPDLDYDLYQFVNVFTKETIFEFNSDAELWVGDSYEGDTPTPQEKCEKAIAAKELAKAEALKALLPGGLAGEAVDSEDPEAEQGDKPAEPAEEKVTEKQEEAPIDPAAEEERLLRQINRWEKKHKKKKNKSRKKARRFVYF